MVFHHPGPDDGFEYARLPHLQYYPTPQRMSMARRRRWVRKMVPKTKDIGAIQQPVFYIQSKVGVVVSRWVGLGVGVAGGLGVSRWVGLGV